MLENRPFGRRLRLSVEGESHSKEISFSLEGFPAGVRIDREALAALMERRAPGRNALSTARRESDEVEFLSGIGGDGITDGGTIAGRIANRDTRPSDYSSTRTVPRPGHADFGQWVEYGFIPTGGGSNSGRMTAPLCAAGALCLQYLLGRGVRISAKVDSVGGRGDGFEETILAAKADGDSVGGTIACTVEGFPAGIGGALFAGVEGALSAAMFAIPGVKGIEFGDGFASAARRGSENNDPFAVENGRVVTVGNRHGGILGGRTSGMPIVFRVAMKPTPTIFKPQDSVDLAAMAAAKCETKGRHDPCIALRAVPVVEAMCAFALADILVEHDETCPPICLTLTGRSVEECLAQYASQSPFVRLAEIRADILGDSAAAMELAEKLPVPCILTFRRRADGGSSDAGDDERAEFFRRVLDGRRRFAFVDFEDDFRRDDLCAAAESSGARVIRSVHLFDGPPADFRALCRKLRGSTREIPKVAFMPSGAADVERAFAELGGWREMEHVVCAMGEAGLPSRVHPERTASMLTYASVAGLGKIGHVTPRDLVLMRSGHGERRP